ncbi:MAG: hypothetical protein EA409_06315 [Saprospirales bacterium]|nr:MAG: hypothetical protein EA409_06315 [Saprospirales bacterium]
MKKGKSEDKEKKHLSPAEFTGIKTTKPKTNSAGVTGIVVAMKHGINYMKPGAMARAMFKLNQKGGIDCPGCAWPDPDDDRSKLGEFCENGMKAISEEAARNLIDGNFFSENSVESLRRKSDFELGKLGRLSEPLVYDKSKGHYYPIDWESAFSIISRELNALKDPNQAAFYTSGRTSNEAAFLYQLFVRMYGTNNLPDCSNMCHESSGVGLSETIGLGKGSVTLNDIHQADLLIIMGQNPGTNHPRMLSSIEKCKENGGEVITVNPLPEAALMKFTNPQRPLKILTGGTTITDLFLQLRINGDIPLLKAIMILLLEREKQQEGSVFDREFIEEFTTGFDELIAHLETTSLSDCIEASGVSRDLIELAAEKIATKKRIIICWAMGLTQHKNGVQNIREIVNLLLLKGAIGKEGAGVCPVRGHSNVQGDRTMGIDEAPTEEFLDRLGSYYHFNPPREHGYATVDAIKAMHEGSLKVFVAMGGNFLSAGPDTKLTGDALSSCRMTVHISTKLNRSHLAPGEISLILPCLGRTDIDRQKSGEQFVTVENSMSVLHSSKGVLEPCSPKLKSEVAIICEMAKATLKREKQPDWDRYRDNYDSIRDSIEQIIPGFENFNQRIKKEDFFYLPNGPKNRQFNTHTGKANFSVNPIATLKVEDEQYIMMTIRSHDQFNTTIYGLDDRYRGIYNERRVVLMNPEDMVRTGLKNREVVNLSSNYKGIKRSVDRFIVVPYDIPSGCVATYFPEANALVPYDEYADRSKTPISKSVIISIEKAD